MRMCAVGLVALGALIGSLGPGLAQSFEIGPGGVRVYPDAGPRYYDDRPRYRVYDDRPSPGLCARLREACEYGEPGQGNCRRYRRTCG